MKLPAFSEHDIAASLCRDSFFDFVQEFWSEISDEEPVWNWHIEYLCGVFQAEIERVMRKDIREKDIYINVPPGTTKSTIFSILGPAWIWTVWPECQVICASHTAPLVLNLALVSRTVIESEKYKTLFPGIVLRDDQNVKSDFRNNSGGFRYSCSTKSKPTGRHAHVIIVDDPMDPSTSLSKKGTEDVHRFMRQTLPSRKVDKKTAATFVIMQRLGQNDTTGERLARDADGVRHICLPAVLTKDVRPVRLRAKYVGGLLDPVRLSKAVLADQEKDLGQFAYAGQFLQTPTPAGGAMFHTAQIKIVDIPPVGKPVSVVRYWDKAATSDDGCYTVGCKMAKYKEKDADGKDINDMYSYYVLDIIRVRLDAFAREKLLKQTAIADGLGVKVGLEQEPGGAGKESAQNTARRLGGYMVTLDRVTGAKEVRAVPFSSQVNAGAVFLIQGAWNSDYLEELRYFPTSLFMDQVDASSGAFNMLVTPRKRVGALW